MCSASDSPVSETAALTEGTFDASFRAVAAQTPTRMVHVVLLMQICYGSILCWGMPVQTPP